MSDLVYFANPQRAQEQASEWVARLDAGLTDLQKRDLREWLSAHPSHPEVLARMAALWDDMDILEELSTLFPLPRRTSSHDRHRWAIPAAAACGVAAVLVATGLWFWESHFGTSPRDNIAVAQYHGHYETGIGEQSTEMLPDGSSVTLNTDSSIDVIYSAAERRIVMNRGEALYQVMKDPQRPFDVHAASHLVQAVGTAFDVRLKAKQVDVTVTKGVVKVLFAPMATAQRTQSGNMEPRPQEAVLRVGDTAAFVSNRFSVETVRRLDQHNMEMQLSWKDGMLVFEDEPLSDVLDEVGRYTPIKLVAGPELRNIKVGGYFKAGDIDGLLVALQKNFGIGAERASGNRIVLRRQ